MDIRLMVSVMSFYFSFFLLCFSIHCGSLFASFNESCTRTRARTVVKDFDLARFTFCPTIVEGKSRKTK